MAKIFVMIGFGRTINGLLYPCFQKQLEKDVVFICCVRETDKWLNRKKAFFSIKSKLVSPEDNIVLEEEWLFSKSEETFLEFAERCQQNNHPGIWLFKDGHMLGTALNQSFVVGTSIGVEALDSLFKMISVLDFQKPIYAFENQPPTVMQIARKYDNLKIFPCPIDRVVVSREFRDDLGIVTIKLGTDASEAIMVYDINGIWKQIIVPRENSPLTITENSGILNSMLKKKLYCKNVTHKLACQLVALTRERSYIKGKSLSKVISKEEIEKMKRLKDAIIIPTFVDIMMDLSNPSMESCASMYYDLSVYYDDALSTVTTDPNDTIGRIIHLDTHENAVKDKQRLIESLKYLKSALGKSINPIIKAFLYEKVGSDLNFESLLQSVDNIIWYLGE